MYLINYTYTLRALDNYVYAYNEKEEHYHRKVRAAMVATAAQLLKIYGIALAKAYKRKPFTAENLPSLRTNNVQIAKLTHASTRTAHRHLIRLQEAGIITKKIWHGSKAPYELWFNPEVLHLKLPIVENATETTATMSAPKAKKAVDKYVDKPVNNPKLEGVTGFLSYTENQCVKNKNTPNCRNTDTSNIKKYINNKIIDVHKFSTFHKETHLKGHTGLKKTHLKGHTGQDRTPLSLRNDSEKGHIFFKGHTQEKALLYKHAQEKVDSQACEALQDMPLQTQYARESLLLSYANKLWLLAKEKLYGKTILTQTQQAIAEDLLYLWYEPVANDALEKVHQVYVKRIEMVRSYVAQAPTSRFVQLPYLFFDPDNPNGFTRTKQWKTDANYLRKKQVQRKFFAIINYFKRNELKDTAEAIPRLQCYKRCEKAIKALQQPDLLQEFYQASLQILQPSYS